MNSPTLIQKASNVAVALTRAVKAVATGQEVIVSDEEVQRRLLICATCEFFTGATCRLCGCLIKFKTKLTTERCPVGKWGKTKKDMLYNVTIEVEADDVAQVVAQMQATGKKIIAANPKPVMPPRPPATPAGRSLVPSAVGAPKQ